MARLPNTLRLLVAGLLAWPAQAATVRPVVLRGCTRDSCYSQVFATDLAGRSAQGAKDCTSYLQSTVIPYPVTATSTVTTSSLASVRYTSVTVTVTTTLVASSTSTSVDIVNVTPTTYITEIATVATTVTTSTLGATANAKRDILEARQLTTCPSTVAAPVRSNAPRYAPDCTGTRFSSVCSCNSQVPTAAVTASPSTVTTTVTMMTPYTTLSTTTVTSTTTLNSVESSVVTITSIVTAPAVTFTQTTTTTATSTIINKYMEASVACPNPEVPDTPGNNHVKHYCVGTPNLCTCQARTGMDSSTGGICSYGYLPLQPCNADTDCQNGGYCLDYSNSYAPAGFRSYCSWTQQCV